MKTRWIARGVAALVVTVGVPALAACSKDTDCKGARVCEDGKCVNPPATPPTKASPPASMPSDGPKVVTPGPGDNEESAPPPAEPPPGVPPPAGHPSRSGSSQRSAPPPDSITGEQEGQPPPSYPPPGGYPPPTNYPPRYAPYPPPYRQAPYRTYYRPPPPPSYEPSHVLAARLQVAAGIRANSDYFGNGDSNGGVGFSGGLGVYLTPTWGLMGNFTYEPGYPRAVITTAQIFANTPYIWGAFGAGWGRFTLPAVPSVDEGLALTGTLLFKATPHLGLGLQVDTVNNYTAFGTNSYGSFQFALAWIY